MRRARLQIKPNLGPRSTASSRSQSHSQPASTDAAATTRGKSVVLSASQPTITPQDAKQDQFTVLKVTESKSESSVMTGQSPAHSEVSITNKSSVATSSPLNDSVFESPGHEESTHTGAISHSHRKSHSAESATVQSSDKNEHDISQHSLTRKLVNISPGRLRSAMVPSTTAVSTTESPVTDKQTKPLQRNILSSPVKGPLFSAEKGQLPRSRFSKVRPNLVDSARNRHRVSELGQSHVSEPEVRGQDEVQNHSETVSAVDVTAEEHASSAADKLQSVESTGDASQSSTTLPVITVMPATEQAKEVRQDKDVSDSASEVSTSADFEMDESISGESEMPLKPEEKKNQALEKKSRHPKGTLPSTDAPVDRNMMKMVDLIYWNPNRNRMRKKESRLPKPSGSNTSQETASSESVDGEASNMSDSLPVPQVKIGPDGNIILNVESLVVENKPAESMEQSSDLVEEDEDRFINCNSFRTNKKGKLWTKNETNRFFRALQQVGTDFSLMCSLFPSRTRRELKNKFRKEERSNRPLVDKALREREQFNRKTFELARAEDEAENRRRKKSKTGKQKKKKKKQEMAESEEEDGDEEEEEEDLVELEAMEEEERKENSHVCKRAGAKITDDEDTEFPGYETKRRRREPDPKHKEVVDILVNMSQGKVQRARDDGEVSETSSLVSERSELSSVVDGAEDRPFVPRVVGRSIRQRHNRTRSSGNVIIDSQGVTDPMQSYLDSLSSLPAGKPFIQTLGFNPSDQADRVQSDMVSSVGADKSLVSGHSANAISGAGISPIKQSALPGLGAQVDAGKVAANSALPSTRVSNVVVGQSVNTVPNQNVITVDRQTPSTRQVVLTSQGGPANQRSPVQGGGLTIPPSVLSAIEQLQVENNNSMDIVLVEDHSTGQSVVHIYVVPKTSTQTAVASEVQDPS